MHSSEHKNSTNIIANRKISMWAWIRMPQY